MLAFTRTDLERLFPSTTWQRAESLRDQSAVVEINVERDGRSITGRVRGERRTPYPDAGQHRQRARWPDPAVQHLHLPRLQRVRACRGHAAGGARRDRRAGCRRGQRRDRPRARGAGSPPSTRALARSPTGMPATVPTASSTCSSRRSACGATRPRSSRSAVSTFRARRLRGGVYGREHPLAMSNLVADDPASFVGIDDQVIGRLLGAPNAQTKRLGSVGDGDTLRRMLETGRCHWRNGQSRARCAYEVPRAGRFGWQFDSEGQQHVVCELDNAARRTWSSSASASPGTSISRTHGLRPDRDQRAASRRPTAAAGTRRCRRRSPASCARSCSRVGDALPLPEPLRKRERLEMRPTPILHLHCPRVTISRGMGWKREEQDVDLPLARVLFDYAGAEVGWQDGRAELNHVKDNRLLVLPRDTLFEVQIDRAPERPGPAAPGPHRASAGSRPRTAARTSPSRRTRTTTSRCAGSSSTTRTCPSSRGDGWRITFGEDYPYQVVAADDAWKVDINDSGHRLVRPRSRHRGRRRAGGAAADPARPVRPGARGSDARGRSTSSARTMSSALCRTAACCRSRPPASRRCSRRSTSCSPAGRIARRRHVAPVAGRDDAAHGDRDARCRTARCNGPAARAARHGAAPGDDQRDPGRRRRPRASRRPCATTRRTASPGCSS